MGYIEPLRIGAKLFSLLFGGYGVFTLYGFASAFPHPAAYGLVPNILMFFGGAILLLWVIRFLPGGSPQRGKTFRDRILNLLD